MTFFIRSITAEGKQLLTLGGSFWDRFFKYTLQIFCNTGIRSVVILVKNPMQVYLFYVGLPVLIPRQSASARLRSERMGYGQRHPARQSPRR